MAIDASIYQNASAPQVEMPNIADSMSKAMSLSQMAMQNRQAQLAMQNQQAMRDAYAKNTDPSTGQVNQQSFLSDLGKANPQAAMDYQEKFNKMNKDAADAQAAKMEATAKITAMTLPKMNYLASMPEDKRAIAFPGVMKQLETEGAPMQNVPKDSDGNYLYDPGFFRQAHGVLSQTADNLAMQKSQAETQNTQAQASKVPSEIADTQAKTAKTISETYAKPNAPVGQDVDPSMLVPSKVPQPHQQKVFDEIKTAQDINNLSPQIIAAFKKGSSRNPVEAAQGQREFEGLINTTVKDTEGTARQAAFDSIHKTMTPSGITASPGENDTKMRTVLEYLQSKQSAPTAKGYGIDLSKYPSTTPYKPDGGGSKSSSQTGLASNSPRPGAIIAYGGKHYTVGSDGVTLTPVKGGQ